MTVARAFVGLVLGVVLAATAVAGEPVQEANPIQPADRAAPAAPAVPDPVPSAEQAAEIAGLVGQLGDGKFEVRDAAYKRLLAIGRPALSALRGATASRDAEVSASAVRLVSDIEKNIRVHVRVKVLRPTEPGEREVILESEEATVTVRETRREFTVAVQKNGGAAELSSAPSRAEFQTKFPELWKRWAEPALDATDPDKLAVEAMVRQLLPQIIAAYAKEQGRQPTAEEQAEAVKLLREQARQALEAKKAKEKAGAEPEAPVLRP